MSKPTLVIKADTKILDRLLRAVPGRADDITGKTAHDIQKAAVNSMKGGGGAPSSPGEPPHRQIGNLVNSAYTKKIKVALWETGFATEYALPLEKGTSRMAARPYLGPQVESHREPYNKALRELAKV